MSHQHDAHPSNMKCIMWRQMQTVSQSVSHASSHPTFQNLKVDNMTMALHYRQRAMVILVQYTQFKIGLHKNIYVLPLVTVLSSSDCFYPELSLWEDNLFVLQSRGMNAYLVCYKFIDVVNIFFYVFLQQTFWDNVYCTLYIV